MKFKKNVRLVASFLTKYLNKSQNIQHNISPLKFPHRQASEETAVVILKITVLEFGNISRKRLWWHKYLSHRLNFG